jgi:beta-glucosidase
MSPARPRRGRAHESYGSYGKDPYPLSALGLAYVRGLQSEDATTRVAATTKPFVRYSAGLNTATTHLGSHKLHDLYAPP